MHSDSPIRYLEDDESTSCTNLEDDFCFLVRASSLHKSDADDKYRAKHQRSEPT